MDEADILPRFQGIGIHDHWFPYFAYKQITHGLCNAHHLRELTFIHEQEKEDWALRMKDLLVFAKNEVERHLDRGGPPQEVLLQIEETYTQVNAEGFEYHSLLPSLPKGKRGRQKQRDGKNLLDRLKEKRSCVLRFMHDFSACFTNYLVHKIYRGGAKWKFL
jgi:transposase